MSFHSGQIFTFGEQPSATKWQWVWDNDYALADGSGISDNAIIARHIASSVITSSKIDWAAATGKIWWEELGRTTLGSVGDTISLTSFTARKYLRLQISLLASGAIRGVLRFNNDSANNYSQRYSFNNAAETTGINTSGLILSPAETSTQLIVVDILNNSANEKPVTGTGLTTGTAGAGNTSTSAKGFGKWANTAAQVSRIDIVNDQAGDFATSSQFVVLGHD